jgi:peptide/nickel transport system permease protein
MVIGSAPVTLADSRLSRPEPAAWTAPTRWLWRFARRKPLGFVGLAILAGSGLSAIFAGIVAPYGYADTDFLARLEGPSRTHLLGTDNLGRDLLSRVIYGTRVSFGISFAAVLLAKSLATLVAVISGYWGGWFDKLFQRLIDIWIALPLLIILITLIGVLGQGAGTLILVVGLGNAPGASRLVRSVVVQVREEPYILAAESLGASDARIMLRHVLPNIAHIVIFSATVTLGSVILIVASLGFLGYGVPPPQPDLGAMLSGDGLTFMRRHWIMAFWPGLAITLIVFAFNVLGDALRDVLDPRLRGA